MASSYLIQSDGSFSINAGGFRLQDCFPGIDGKPVRTISVKVNEIAGGSTIEYALQKGKIELRLQYSEEGIMLESKLSGFECMPHWFYPIFGATLPELEGAFRQSFGIGGPSGYCAAAEIHKQDIRFESHGLVAVRASGALLIFHVLRHERFMHRYTIKPADEDCVEDRFSAGFKLERIPVSEASMPEIFINVSDDLQQGLELTAVKIAAAMRARPVTKQLCHWDSWYYLYENFNQAELEEYTQAFRPFKKDFPIEYILVDAGFSSAVGDWLSPSYRFPQGLEHAFETIKREGYTPAIWSGPFMVGNRSKLFREHPDWILRYLDGALVTPWRFFNERKVWSYQDEEYYVLDTSHPEAMEYMRTVFETYTRWGIRLYKIDFMLWGIQDSTTVRRHTPGKTSIEYFRDFLEMYRGAVGEDTYIIGCIAPYLPFLGIADAMRFAWDSGVTWSNDPTYGWNVFFRETQAQQYNNLVYWQNDGDMLMIRDFHTHLTEEEAKGMALLQALSGCTTSTSDPLHLISRDRYEFYRFVIPPKPIKPIVPFLEQGRKEVVLSHRLSGGRRIVFIFNVTEEERVFKYTLRELTGDEKVWMTRWGCKEEYGGPVERFSVRIPAHGYALYFANVDGPVKGNCKSLWEWE